MKKVIMLILLANLFICDQLNVKVNTKHRSTDKITIKFKSKNTLSHQLRARLKKKVQIMPAPTDLRLKDKVNIIKLEEQYLKKLQASTTQDEENQLWFRVRFINDFGVEESLFQKKTYYFSGSNFYFTEQGNSKRGIIKGMDILKAVTNSHDNIKEGLCCEKVKSIKRFVLNNTDFQGYCFQVLLYNDEWSLCHENKNILSDFRLLFRANIVREYSRKYNMELPKVLQDPYNQIESKYSKRRKMKV